MFVNVVKFWPKRSLFRKGVSLLKHKQTNAARLHKQSMGIPTHIKKWIYNIRYIYIYIHTYIRINLESVHHLAAEIALQVDSSAGPHWCRSWHWGCRPRTTTTSSHADRLLSLGWDRWAGLSRVASSYPRNIKKTPGESEKQQLKQIRTHLKHHGVDMP